MKIIWSESAIEDLENLKNYIAQDSEQYAVIFIKKVIAAVEKLQKYPRIGRIVPETGNENIREIIYQHYRIIYKLEKSVLSILTVVHGGRDLSGWS